MTFEEIHDKIASGGRPENMEEIVESLHKLETYGGKTPQMTALRLAESRKMYDSDDKHWVRWAVHEFGYRNENETHHRRAVGDMLYDLRDAEFAVFTRFLSTDISKLYELTEIHKNLPLETLLNFIRLHFPNDDVRRDILRAEKAKLLNKPDVLMQPELDLKFDVAGDTLDEDDLVRRTEAAGFDEERALTMGTNGVLLCSTAIHYVVRNHARIEREAQGEARVLYLSWLRDQEQKMRAAADQLRELAGELAEG